MSHSSVPERVGTLATASTLGRSFLSRAVRRSETESSSRGEHEAPKGPLGLTTLYKPVDEAILDLIFVHGLNGGSQSTWSKGDVNFWPREWLPEDDDFRDVRIHSFGYSSALNAQGSVLNVQDFANNLLAFIQHSPIASSDVSTPIIFVAHSMGGLVVKKAYIISQQNSEYKDIAMRVRGIFFLATPHQGAGIAQLLNRLLALTPGSKPFVDDLTPQSNMLQSINEEFPRYSNHLQLYSFYETQSMYYGVGRGLIVDKHCAVMNYPNERRTYLDANHRDVARFSSPSDPSYCLVRNALATAVSNFRVSLQPDRQNVEQDDMAALIKFLGVTDSPEDDHISYDSQKLPGSCQWLIERDSFQHWRDAMSSKTMWLRGRPGSGKSVMASHVISHLESMSFECSYFFFKNAEKSESSANAFLRLIALQMAASNPEILVALSRASNNWTEPPIDEFHSSRVWRKIFLSGMLKVQLNKPHYWVIDSLDECSDGEELMLFLSKAQELWPLSIFITARAAADNYINGLNRKMDIFSETIIEDNKSDISAFLTAHLESLPAASTAAKHELANRVLEKSNGCFLWVDIVLRELREACVSEQIEEVLNSSSAGMDQLYARILEDMSRAKYGKKLVRSILLWVTTAFRPLSTEELKYSIEKDINDSINNVEKSINSLCGNLVYVGQSNQVQLVHWSAREYMTREDNRSEFAIPRRIAHKTLALACLQALSGSRGGRNALRRVSKPRWLRGESVSQNQTPLHDYASTYVFQHLLLARSGDEEVCIELAKFLRSDEILSWIEKSAASSDLQRIYQAGKICISMARRCSQHLHLIDAQNQVDFINRWGNDLMRLVNKFTRQLIQSPWVIRYLIPPFCPPDSALRKQFGISPRGFSVHGQTIQNWDDCLSTINYSGSSKPTEIESSEQYVAVALSNGHVIVYRNELLVQTQVLAHGEPVWSMACGETKGLLATGGAKMIRVWDLRTSTQIIELPAPALCLALAFLNNDSSLWMALRKNTILVYDFDAHNLQDPIDWSEDFGEQEASLRLKRPTMAKFCPHQRLLAIVYPGENILLWDLNEEALVDIYSKDIGTVAYGESAGAKGSATARSIAFVSTMEDNMLVASYSDGDVVLFSTDTGEIRGSLDGINALTVACSPDGRTLATADSQGNIQLFDPSTLKCLYRLSSNTSALRTRRLSFTADSLRLLDIGGSQLRAWIPTVLLRQQFEDGTSDTTSVTTMSQRVDYSLVDQIPITCMTCVRRTPEVLCGKADGSVHVYDIRNEPRGQQLFIQTPKCAVAMIYFDEDAGIVTCSDVACRITSRRLYRKKNGTYDVEDLIIDMKIDSAVSQVLCSGKAGRLLVSTFHHDTLWSISTDEGKRQIAQIRGTPRPSWLPLPGNGEVLIHIELNTANFYKWSTLEKVRSIRLSMGDHTALLMTSVLLFQHQEYFATMHKNDSPMDRHSGYYLWDLKDFSYEESSGSKNQSAESVAFPQFHLSSTETNIEALVGVLNEQAVFLGTNHWVYSAEMINSNGFNLGGTPQPSTLDSSGVQRHFFFPDDWSSSINRVLIDIRRSGEIVFVKSTELIVIRRGLQVTEEGGFISNRGLAIQQSKAK